MQKRAWYSVISHSGELPISLVEETRRGDRLFGWQQLRFAVAAVLFAAAVSKIINSPQILAGGGLLGTTPRLLFVIAFEATAATWLVIGSLFWSWILTLVTFSVFVASTGYAVFTGQSCNCFGGQFSPQAVMFVDIVVLSLAAYFRPLNRIRSSKRQMLQIALAGVVGVTFAGTSVWKNQTVARSEPLEFLLADMLIGKPWPLDAQLHSDLDQLNTGKWLIVVVREDCDHCRQMMAHQFSDPQTHRPNERTAIFIAGSNEWRIQLDEVSFDVSGDTFIIWPAGEPFVASPAVFLIENGIVVEAADGNESERFIETLFGESSGS